MSEVEKNCQCGQRIALIADEPQNRFKVWRLMWLITSFKILYFILLYCALSFEASEENRHGLNGNVSGGMSGLNNYICHHFSTWDSSYYLYIASHGYSRGDFRCAFYPLYPFIIKLCSLLMGGDEAIAGILVANISSIAGACLFFMLVQKRMGMRVAHMSLLLLLIFPGALFFQFVYSEGLFFFLLMMLAYNMDRGRYGIASVAAFLLPLTRAVGVFCVVPIIWDAIERYVLKNRQFGKSAVAEMPATMADPMGGYSNKSANNSEIEYSLKWKSKYAFLLVAPFLGWVTYVSLMWLWTGNAFEGFSAQNRFGCESIQNIFNTPRFVVELIAPTSFHEFYGSMLDRSCFILLIYCLFIIWRLDKGWFLWSAMLGVVPAMSGMFVSYTRFVSIVFPLFIAMAVFFNRPGRMCRFAFRTCVCCFLVVHIINVWRFVNLRWAG